MDGVRRKSRLEVWSEVQIRLARFYVQIPHSNPNSNVWITLELLFILWICPIRFARFASGVGKRGVGRVFGVVFHVGLASPSPCSAHVYSKRAFTSSSSPTNQLPGRWLCFDFVASISWFPLFCKFIWMNNSSHFCIYIFHRLWTIRRRS